MLNPISPKTFPLQTPQELLSTESELFMKKEERMDDSDEKRKNTNNLFPTILANVFPIRMIQR